MSLTGSLRDVPVTANDEYQKLREQHHEYESRLSLLADKAVLSDEEQVEESTLKKKKLQIRDRMEAIVRDVQIPH